jgi:hypothetical protein
LRALLTWALLDAGAKAAADERRRVRVAMICMFAELM